ncbi:MAG: hypothetical protein HQ503_04770 [Rhodospirillales bacterium]|nr:hypothetical protein [Rhodospirillales bacterium]
MSTHAIELEAEYNVPTVALHTDIFHNVVKSVRQVKGLPEAPHAFVPQPVMGKSADELRAYVDGDDPITGRPFMQEVIEGLTQNVTADSEDAFPRNTPRLVEPRAEEDLHQLFMDNNWTDYLPIILPTEERVAEMLAHTSRAPGEVVGRMQPTHNRGFWEYDVEKVAVNAVMAGCRPEYFPVVLALASSGISARGSTSSSAAVMVVINGPVRGEIGVNSGIGAMGPYAHANATIGRAYGLLSQNLQGGSVAGSSFMGSQGNNYTYNSVTFAENEERSPWHPFHVQKGFAAEASTVSVFNGLRSTSFCLGVRDYWREHVRDMLLGIEPNTPPVFLLDPIAARLFAEREGFDTKEKLIHWAWENATMPSARYFDLQLVQNYIYPRATFGEEPFASMLAADDDELIPMFREAEINIVTVGGETNGYWQIQGAHYRGTYLVDEWR